MTQEQNTSNGAKSPPLMHLLLLLNRITVGWFFVGVGWRKVAGEINEGLGTFQASDGYQDRNPSWIPDFVASPYGYALPWIELIFGALLLIGLFGRVTAGVLTFVLLTIGVALLGAGDLFPTHHVTVFFTVTLLLFFWGSGRYSVDGLISRKKSSAKG